MKRPVLLLLLFALPISLIVGCLQSNTQNTDLEARIDSLQTKVDTAYVPGTGLIMNTIVQPHHLKLWFAGKNQNWALAEYERQELMGGFEKVQIYHKNEPEASAVAMIFPAMQAIEKSITQKDPKSFKQNFIMLTKTCNTCHRALKYEFNAIKVPAANSFDNQSF